MENLQKYAIRVFSFINHQHCLRILTEAKFMQGNFLSCFKVQNRMNDCEKRLFQDLLKFAQFLGVLKLKPLSMLVTDINTIKAAFWLAPTVFILLRSKERILFTSFFSPAGFTM